MLQPIELLQKELTRLKDIESCLKKNNLESKESELIPAYENSISILEKVNSESIESDCNHYWIEWESNNYIPRSKCVNCGEIK
jgi:hypothetical protein